MKGKGRDPGRDMGHTHPLTSGANGHSLNALTINAQSRTVYSLIHLSGSIRCAGGRFGSVNFGIRLAAPIPRLLSKRNRQEKGRTERLAPCAHLIEYASALPGFTNIRRKT